MTKMIWAFNKAGTREKIKLIYDSIKDGKSRFGWSYKDKHNLKIKENWAQNSRQLFLLKITKGDWIVHVNTPKWGRCIAAKVISEYNFDQGLKTPKGYVFRHCFEIDVNSIMEFDRNDPYIPPTVNLKPRYRYQRIYAVDDFLKAVDNLRNPPNPYHFIGREYGTNRVPGKPSNKCYNKIHIVPLDVEEFNKKRPHVEHLSPDLYCGACAEAIGENLNHAMANISKCEKKYPIYTVIVHNSILLNQSKVKKYHPCITNCGDRFKDFLDELQVSSGKRKIILNFE